MSLLFNRLALCCCKRNYKEKITELFNESDSFSNVLVEKITKQNQKVVIFW